MAAGILGCGSVILGVARRAGQLMNDILAREPARAATSTPPRARSSANTAQPKRPIPGYGHPQHKGEDPRAIAADRRGPRARRCPARTIDAALKLDQPCCPS